MFFSMQKMNSIPNFFFLWYCKDNARFLHWVLWECLIMTINNDSITLLETLMDKQLKSNSRKLWRLPACKKSTSFLTSFLRYCQNIENLLFWEFWECLTISNKIIVSICNKLSWLSACKESSSSLTSFLTYCKEIANLLFWVFWVCLATHNQNDSINLKKPLRFICSQKNHLHLLCFPWDISLKCCLRYFGHARLRTPKVILSSCIKRLYLSAGKKTKFIPHAFRRCCKDM